MNTNSSSGSDLRRAARRSPSSARAMGGPSSSARWRLCRSRGQRRTRRASPAATSASPNLDRKPRPRRQRRHSCRARSSARSEDIEAVIAAGRWRVRLRLGLGSSGAALALAAPPPRARRSAKLALWEPPHITRSRGWRARRPTRSSSTRRWSPRVAVARSAGVLHGQGRGYAARLDPPPGAKSQPWWANQEAPLRTRLRLRLRDQGDYRCRWTSRPNVTVPDRSCSWLRSEHAARPRSRAPTSGRMRCSPEGSRRTLADQSSRRRCGRPGARAGQRVLRQLTAATHGD